MLTKILSRRSYENPATPLSAPDDWLGEAVTGGTTATGLRVGSVRATTYSPVWRAVSLIANTVTRLPIHVFRRSDDGEGKERAREHPAYPILRRKAHEFYTADVFVMMMTARACLWGNAYAHIVRGAQGEPVALLPFLPGNCYPAETPSGRVVYVAHVRLEGKDERVTLDASDVLHLRGVALHSNTAGESIVEKARESFARGIAAGEYQGRFFGKGGRPSVVLQHPGRLDKEARENVQASWERMHAGLDNAHKTAVLAEGMEANVLGVSNVDAQMIETRKFEPVEVANWFNLPPHKLGASTNVSYKSLEQENQAFVDDAIDPWLLRWECECYDKLLTETEKRAESHIIEFNRNALARANMRDRGMFYNLGVMGGWLSRDEVRASENRNPIPGDEGKTFLEPMNMRPAGSGGDEGDEGDEGEPAEDAGTDSERAALLEAVRGSLVDVAGRFVRRLVNQAARYRTRSGKFLAWFDDEMQGPANREAFAAAFAPVGAVLEALEPGGAEEARTALEAGVFERVRLHYGEATAANEGTFTGTVDEAGKRLERAGERAVAAYLESRATKKDSDDGTTDNNATG